MITSNDDKLCRDEFEAMLQRVGYNLKRLKDGSYESNRANTNWMYFQAGAAWQSRGQWLPIGEAPKDNLIWLQSCYGEVIAGYINPKDNEFMTWYNVHIDNCHYWMPMSPPTPLSTGGDDV